MSRQKNSTHRGWRSNAPTLIAGAEGVVLLYDLNDSKGAIRAWKELIEVNPFARAHGNELVVELIEKLTGSRLV